MNDDMGLTRTWSPQQLGIFIDQVRDDHFFPLWLLVATTGLRLDSLVGLERDEVDLQARKLYPRARPIAVGDPSRPPAFSVEGYALDPDAYDALREHVIQWDKEREDFAPDARNLFLWSDGTPVHTNAVSSMYHQHCDQAGLPAVPLQEMRQAYVVAALETGIPTAILRERLGDQVDSPSMGVGAEPKPRITKRQSARKRERDDRTPDDTRPRQQKSRHLRSV